MKAERRLMMVHAHPDDESSSTGAALARYVAEGASVTLVTCTLGEEGEIFVPELALLAAGQGDQLGGWRLAEWERACAELGVTDRRILGGAGRYRDSGMMGEESNRHPRSFWQADLEEAARLCLEVIREVRPQVLVTYDENGMYGHPDHIQAHRVAMRAAELAAEEGFGPERIYWTAMPHSYIDRTIEEFRGSTGDPFAEIKSAEELPFGRPDSEIDVRLDGTAYAEQKRAALRAYATQIPADSPFVTTSSPDWLTAEHFVLARGERGRTDDLFGSPHPADVFTNEMEAEVSRIVLGDRVHGM